MSLPTYQKLRLIQKVLKEGSCVSTLCRENKISRKTFYAWKKKYLTAGPRRKATCLQNNHPKGLKHFRGTKNAFKNEILDIVTTHPEWGSHTINKKLALRLRSGSNALGNHGVYSLLKELNLETFSKRKQFALLHRSLKTVKEAYLPGQRRLLSETRKRMVEEVLLAGKAVGEVAKEFNISRKTLWKWAKRYEKAKNQEIQLIISLEDQNPKGSSHPRGIASWLEQKILNEVVKNPSFSTHQLAKIIPEVGNHGIQNVLLRNGLNKIDMRIRYAQTHAPVVSIQPVKTWVGRLKSVFESFVPSVSSAPPPLKEYLKPFFLSFFSTTVFLLAFLNWISIFSAQAFGAKIGLFFASISLATGTVFFAYSMKYYLSLALVLSFSSRENGGSGGIGPPSPKATEGAGWLRKIFSSAEQNSGGLPVEASAKTGLQANLDHIKLERYPFISIHLPFYNEKKVANRIISACTSMDYPNFEVIVCDDSTDETVDIVNQWKNHPRVRILHRPTREGFKGGALSFALKAMDPRTEFVCVFDADFVPYPDSLTQFMKYFKSTGSWSEERVCRADSIQTMPYSTFGEVPQESQVPQVPQAFYSRDTRDTSPSCDTFTRQEQELRKKGTTAVVAGYQWHVLNKSENWITRGVRTEYSGSYVIERPAQEITGALKIIHGSVYCMRADVLKHFGWGVSITEDYELTLRIYEKGFRVCYTPYIQAPSECVSTIKRLIRQRMRWAEGHSFNTRKMFGKLMFGYWKTDDGRLKTDGGRQMAEDRLRMTDDRGQKTENQISVFSPQIQSSVFGFQSSKSQSSKVWIPSPLTLTEKLEFLFLTPYYLQAFLFIVGTLAWLLSEIVFRVRLPFWTALWGWSLILTNFLALPLLNGVGLFLEESEEKDYVGILSFVVLCYIVVPFQAYAAVKGFIEEREGPWFRTPKTGVITDILTRGRFYRWLTGILRWKPNAGAVAASRLTPAPNFQFSIFNSQLSENSYLALTTANNRFNNFRIRPKKARYLAKAFTVLILIVSMNLSWLSFKVPLVHASPGTQIKTIEMPIYQYASATDITATRGISSAVYGASHDTGQYTSQAFYNSIPYIAYYDVTMGDLKFIKCGNDTCSSGNTISTIDGAMVKDGTSETNVGQYISMQVVSGTPYISYYDVTNANLKFVKCGNDTCSSGNTISIVDSTGDVGQYTSLQVVSGTPYISYYDVTNTDLKFVKCGNDTCSSGNTINTVDNTDTARDGYGTSLQVVAGVPYIAYDALLGASTSYLKFVKCGNDTCSSGNTINTVDSYNYVSGGRVYPSLVISGSVPYISYYDVFNTNLKFVKCGNDACSSGNTINQVDNGDDSFTGQYSFLQIVSGTPYVSYVASDSTTGYSLKFVKCGNDTCSTGNTISTIESVLPPATGTLGTYNSFQIVSSVPYISYYKNTTSVGNTVNNLIFVKCGDDTCDNSPANTISTAATGGFGVGFHLDIPETMVDCLTGTGGTNACYAYVEWRFILSANDVTSGEMKFAREEGTALTQSLTTINTNSGENQPFIIRQDVTSAIQQGFATYYFDANVNQTRNGDSAKLVVSYEYDDTATTQTKTVRYALGTQAAQGASGDCGPDVTVNPNIQEADVKIQKAWVEMTGQVSAGTTDAQAGVYQGDASCASGHMYAAGGTSTTNIYLDGAGKTTYDFVAMAEPTSVAASGVGVGALNWNANNTISLYNTGQVMNIKGGELIITYEYSYYNQTSTTHRNMAKYHVGQLPGALPNSYTSIGAPAVYLPESSLSNYNAYLKIVGTNTAAAATRYRVTITGGSAVEYPSASTYYATVVSEQAGRNVIFIDISSNFNSNWSSGDTVTVEALGDTANETYAIGAELIISYNFVIPTSGTFTAIKTINWYAGQNYYRQDVLSATFATYIPETSTTKRSSGSEGNLMISSITTPYYLDVRALMGINTSHTGENMTSTVFDSASSLTAVSQSGLTCYVSANNNFLPMEYYQGVHGAIFFTTYEVTAPAAVPEKALLFLLIAPFWPKIVEWWRRRRMKTGIAKRERLKTKLDSLGYQVMTKLFFQKRDNIFWQKTT